jgi:dihydrofolate reductase
MNMRKVIFLIHMSLDGYVAGPNGEMDWIVYNDEVERDGHYLHATTDAAIYGRVTYQMMDSYWPPVLADPSSTGGALEHAQWYDRATKIVFSRTLESIPGKNTMLLHANVAAEIMNIKQQPGKNLWLLGSPTLAQTFMQLDLIDEYRINLSPVVLGSGKLLFAGLDTSIHLNLMESRMLAGGVVALRYEPERK